MSKRLVVVVSRYKDLLQCDITAVPDWEGFDKIIQFLQNHYQAKIIMQADGPDARICRLDVRNQVLELQHEDPYGNTLIATSPSAEKLLQSVADDLRQRLAKL